MKSVVTLPLLLFFAVIEQFIDRSHKIRIFFNASSNFMAFLIFFDHMVLVPFFMPWLFLVT